MTVIATSVAQTSQSASATVMAGPAPSVLTTNLPAATPGQPYAASLQGAGGAAPLNWSIASGTLPTGLLMNSAGQFYGTPTSTSITNTTSTFTVKVTDTSGAPAGPVSAQQSLSITVIGVLTVTTAALPNGRVGIAYSAGIETSGGVIPLSWSLVPTAVCGTAGGTIPPGLVLQGTNTEAGEITGTPTAAGTYFFTLTVLDSSSPRQCRNQPLEITINPAGPLTIVTTSLLDGTVGVPYNGALVASGGAPPVSWSLTGGALPAGLNLNPSTGAITGIPTGTPGLSSFSVTATDSSSSQHVQSLFLTINSAAAACSSTGHESALTGQYAFSLSGFNETGFLTAVGAFIADGTGKITAGEVDTNGVLGAQTGSILPTTTSSTVASSSYSVGPDNRGCATIATSFGTFTTRFALGSIGAVNPGVAGKGRIIEFDNPNVGAYLATGQILQQTPSVFASVLTGSFVFRTIGWDSALNGGRDVCVGILGMNAGIIGNLQEDCNDASIITNPSGGTGTYTTFDPYGRGTATLQVGVTTSNSIFYLVSSSQFLMVNTDPVVAISGEADLQSVPPGGFNSGSLSGNLVFYLSGVSGAGSGADVSVNLANVVGGNSVNITSYEDHVGAWVGVGTPPTVSLTCNYTVGSNGLVTLTGTNCGAHPPVLYLTAPNTGIMVDSAVGVDTGFLDPQAPGTFSNASVSGTFTAGLPEVVSQNIGSVSVGLITLDGAGHMGGVSDYTSMTSQASNQTITDTYSVKADGTFSVGSSGSSVVGIIIDGTRFVRIDNVTQPYPIPIEGAK